MRCYIPISDIEASSFSFLPEAEDARMYVLLCRGEALIVDPNASEEALLLLRQAGLQSVTVVLTHEHYDHTSGVNLLREHFECNVVCTQTCARLIQDARRNLSQYAQAQYVMMDDRIKAKAAELVQPFSCTADTTFSGQTTLPFAGHTLALTETLGHSKGSLCMMLDQSIVFTGDSLVPHTPIVTRLPGGSKAEYEAYALPYLRALPRDIWVLPGHFEGAKLEDLLEEVK